jgi:hypothetical protein
MKPESLCGYLHKKANGYHYQHSMRISARLSS